jgi:hypothetical protein
MTESETPPSDQLGMNLPDELDHLLSNAYLMENQSLVVACSSPELVAQLTSELYERNTGDVFHVEHYPCTNDEAGSVEYWALLIRRLSYDRDVGWCSADIADEPEIDLRDYDNA